MRLHNYLTETTKVTQAEYIDLRNPGNNEIKVDSGYKPKTPTKKTVDTYDEVYLAGYKTWGDVQDTLPNSVKVNLNPGMGNRPKIVTVKYDQIVLWRYKHTYAYFNLKREIDSKSRKASDKKKYKYVDKQNPSDSHRQ